MFSAKKRRFFSIKNLLFALLFLFESGISFTSTLHAVALAEYTTDKTNQTTECAAYDFSYADISRIDESRKLIALTFDDAPDSTLRKILEVFFEYNTANPDCPASATVFVNGIRTDDTTLPVLQTAFDFGFELGNHAYSHKDLTRLSPEKIKKEINDVDEMLFAIDGRKRHLLRVPYGHTNEKVNALADAPLINWSIDTDDWTGIPAEKIYQTAFSEKFSGAIILMHDGYNNTVTALKKLLPALKKSGYQAVSISQLARAKNKTLYKGKLYSRFF